MINVIREGARSLECNCYNCRFGVERTKWHLDAYGATAYCYMCYLDEYNDDEQNVYQATHVCKKWREDHAKTKETTSDES